MSKKLLATAALLLSGALSLTACTPPADPGSDNTADNGGANNQGKITAMWNQAFYSLNSSTMSGNNVTNSIVQTMTNDNFTYYDADSKLQNNDSFGTYKKVSDNPLTIEIKIADTAMWNDGTPVTADDVIYQWGAISGKFNTMTAKQAQDKLYKGAKKDELTKAGDGVVYFEQSSAQAALVADVPKISDDGKTLTYTYSKPFADWEPNLLSVGMPAHIAGKLALGITDPKEAKAAVTKAFQTKDNSALSKIANHWNLAYNFKEMPANKDLLVTSGPLKIADMKKAESITLVPNENYKGKHKVNYAEFIIRYNEDANAAVQALRNGEVDIISPQATADVLTSVQAVPDTEVKTGDEASFEHVDLVFNNGGPFDPAKYGGDKTKALKVRQAFLKCIPRQKIVDRLIKPINPDAKIRNSYNTFPGSPNYDDTAAQNGMEQAFTFSVDESKKLLSEAGVTAPTVRFMRALKNERRGQEFQLIKESCEQAGFKLTEMPEADWSSKLGDGSYDAVVFAWSSTSTAVTESDANYRTGGGNNFSGYANPEIDKLYDSLQVETDPAKQKEINIKVEKMLVEDAFGNSIFQFPAVTAWSKKISGPNPAKLSPTVFWNFWEWKTTK